MIYYSCDYVLLVQKWLVWRFPFGILKFDINYLLLGLDQSCLYTLLSSSIELNTFKPDLLRQSEILRGSNDNNGRYARTRRETRKRQETSSRVCNRLRWQAHCTPLPSILLANVQSPESKLDDLRARITFQCDMRDCNTMCLTETWLTPDVPDQIVILSDSFSVFHMEWRSPTRLKVGEFVSCPTTSGAMPSNTDPLQFDYRRRMPSHMSYTPHSATWARKWGTMWDFSLLITVQLLTQ